MPQSRLSWVAVAVELTASPSSLDTAHRSRFFPPSRTVDGAIHKTAGHKLDDYCMTLGGCNVGEAKLSPGFKLPAKYIVGLLFSHPPKPFFF